MCDNSNQIKSSSEKDNVRPVHCKIGLEKQTNCGGWGWCHGHYIGNIWQPQKNTEYAEPCLYQLQMCVAFKLNWIHLTNYQLCERWGKKKI